MFGSYLDNIEEEEIKQWTMRSRLCLLHFHPGSICAWYNPYPCVIKAQLPIHTFEHDVQKCELVAALL